MCSDWKAASNRRNAARSTGPTSATGRLAVRRSALKHGLAAQVVVDVGEDGEAFREMADAHLAAFRPRNDVERELANTFTVAAWVRQQCAIAETDSTDQYIRQILAGKDLAPAEAAEHIRRLAFDPREEACKVRRYEQASVRRLSRACTDFIKLRETGVLDADSALEHEPAISSEGANGGSQTGRATNDSPDESKSPRGVEEPVAAAWPGESANLVDGDGETRADSCTGDAVKSETASDALRPLLEATFDGLGAPLDADGPAGRERANDTIAATIGEARSPLDLQAFEPAGTLPWFSAPSLSGVFEALVLLVCVWWAMAAASGEPPRRHLAWQGETRVATPAVSARAKIAFTQPSVWCRRPACPPRAGRRDDCTTMGKVTCARRPGDASDRRSNIQTLIRSDMPMAQIKATAICGRRRGGAGKAMVIGFAQAARGFGSKAENRARWTANCRRRSKPWQSVPLVRPPPFA